MSGSRQEPELGLVRRILGRDIQRQLDYWTPSEAVHFVYEAV